MMMINNNNKKCVIRYLKHVAEISWRSPVRPSPGGPNRFLGRAECPLG